MGAGVLWGGGVCAAGLRALASGSAESVRQVAAWMTQTIPAPPGPDTLTGASTRTSLPAHDSGDFIESGCLPPDPSTDGDGLQEEPPELAEWTTDDEHRGHYKQQAEALRL